jgi:hypothetical protein
MGLLFSCNSDVTIDEDRRSEFAKETAAQIVDPINPTDLTLTIESGDFTPLATVDLTLTSSLATEMYITDSEECLNGGSWEEIQETKTEWPLAQNNALNTIFVKFRSSTQTESECISASITHDDTAPATPNIDIAGKAFSADFDINLSESAADTNFKEFIYTTTGTAPTDCSDGVATSGTVAITGTSNITFNAIVCDEAGNYSSAALTESYTYSTPTIVIDEGGFTNLATVNLTLAAENVTEMYITNTSGCATGGAWETSDTSKAGWALGSTNALTTVNIKYKSLSGSETNCISDAITHDNILPATPTADLTNKSFVADFNVTLSQGSADTNFKDFRYTTSGVAPTDCTAGTSTSGIVAITGTSDLTLKSITCDEAGNYSTTPFSELYIYDVAPTWDATISDFVLEESVAISSVFAAAIAYSLDPGTMSCDDGSWTPAINASTGEVTGTPTGADIGVCTISVDAVSGVDTINQVFTIYIYPSPTAFTFTGDTDSDWHTASNWFGNAVPTSGDVALFSGRCGVSCTATFAAPVAAAGVDLGPSFAGTVTQGTGQTITVGTSGFLQENGSFVGANANITITGVLTLTGGSFLSTSSVLELRNSPASNITQFTVTPDQSFAHNNGTLKLWSAGSCGPNAVTIDVDSTLDLFNLVTERTVSCSRYSTYTVAAGDVLNILGDITQGPSSILAGAFELKGNYIISSQAQFGLGTVTVNGTTDQTYSFDSGFGSARIIVDKASGIFKPAAGKTEMAMTSLQIVGNSSFQAPSGELLIGISPPANDTVLEVSSTATFDHNNGLLNLFQQGTYCGGHFTSNIVTNGTLDVYDIALERTSGCNGTVTYTVAGGDALNVTNDLTQGPYSKTSGDIELKGNLIVATTSQAGLGTITINGTIDQTYSYDSGVGSGRILINKPSGIFKPAAGKTEMYMTSLQLVGSSSFQAPTGNLTIGHQAAAHDTAMDVSAGSSIDPNGGTITFHQGTSCAGEFTVDIVTNGILELNNIILEKASLCSDRSNYTVAAGDTLRALGDLTVNDWGKLSGAYEVEGDLTYATSAMGGTATVVMNGSINSNLTVNGTITTGTLTVDKTSATVFLTTAVTLSTTGQDLTITAGTLDLNSFALTVDDELYLDTAGYLIVNGGSHTEGTLLGPGNPANITP